jgi:hypothetical protein
MGDVDAATADFENTVDSTWSYMNKEALAMFVT